MNKRIQELIAQCSFTVTDYSMGIDSSYEDFDKEKFAELIVQECAGIYDKIDNGNLHMGSYDYLEALQKTFGVE